MFNEISLMAWIGGVIVFAVGGGAGFFIARQIKDKHTLGLEEQLKTAHTQLDEYQGEVNHHFLKTSQLFNKLTDNYREVYEHLATGAQKLCNDKPPAAMLDLPETKILAATVATTTDTVAATEETSGVDVAADAGHSDATPSDNNETIVAVEEIATTASAEENTDLGEREKAVKNQAVTEPAATDPIPVLTTADPQASDNTLTITEEELKALEANEQKKSEDDIHLGAESTPGVEPERHKAPPSIH